MSVISQEENNNNNFSKEQIDNSKHESKTSKLSNDKEKIPSINKKESELEKKAVHKNNNKKVKFSSGKIIPMIYKRNKSESYLKEEKDLIASTNKLNEDPELLSKIINMESTERKNLNQVIEKKKSNNSKYKYCIIWSHIPLITFLMPFVGHSSIVNSYGFIHDFQSSYFIQIYNEEENGFCKIVYLNLNDSQKLIWDNIIEQIDKVYQKKSFSFCGNNSFKYISNILSIIEYKNKKNYTQYDIFWLIIKEGKFISKCQIFKTYFGWILIFSIIIISIILSI